jgi:hypothetical protein
LTRESTGLILSPLAGRGAEDNRRLAGVAPVVMAETHVLGAMDRPQSFGSLCR